MGGRGRDGGWNGGIGERISLCPRGDSPSSCLEFDIRRRSRQIAQSGPQIDPQQSQPSIIRRGTIHESSLPPSASSLLLSTSLGFSSESSLQRTAARPAHTCKASKNHRLVYRLGKGQEDVEVVESRHRSAMGLCEWGHGFMGGMVSARCMSYGFFDSFYGHLF